MQSSLSACTQQCIELAAAASAERMLLPGDAVPSSAMLSTRFSMRLSCAAHPKPPRSLSASPSKMADDLLRPYGHVIIALSVVLKIRRTSEIDDVIATVLADFELALEQRRRADWHRRVQSAESFGAEYGHADGGAAPHSAHNRMG